LFGAQQETPHVIQLRLLIAITRVILVESSLIVVRISHTLENIVRIRRTGQPWKVAELERLDGGVHVQKGAKRRITRIVCDLGKYRFQ
jgi:hypothetical protein